MADAKNKESQSLRKGTDDSDFRQQNIPAWMPILSPVYVIASFILLAFLLIPAGLIFLRTSQGIVELVKQYDGDGTENELQDCKIEVANAGSKCEIEFTIPENMTTPIYVYYEIDNFYQNHKKYFGSRDNDQLRGLSSGLESSSCPPLHKLKDKSTDKDVLLNPCGFVANTFFNDVITLNSVMDSDDNNLNISMREDGISWVSDLKQKFGQVYGFKSEACASCDDCSCNSTVWSCEEPYIDDNGICHLYFYPDEDTTQYAYETYPMVINPIEGILNEHFLVWMRTAALPKFRKLYGYIPDSQFKTITKGSVLTFEIETNWVVSGFAGRKSLVVTESSYMGGRNDFVGWLYIGVGIFCAVAGIFFSIIHVVAPRKLGDKRFLRKFD